METYGDTVMMSDNKQGADRVKKEREAYAFFMESSMIEFEVQRNCDLTEVGTWLDNKAYGIAMPFSEFQTPCPFNLRKQKHHSGARNAIEFRNKLFRSNTTLIIISAIKYE